MAHLPISGEAVTVRALGGVEDLMLLERPGEGTQLALDLVERVGTAGAEGTARWRALPVPDLEAGLLLIRQAMLGDRIRAETRCTAAECGARIDVDFSIDEYFAHHKPRKPRNVAETPDGEWYQLAGTETRFRLPVVADLLAVAQRSKPALEIARRCMRPADGPAAIRKRVERALAALAPSLSHELAGSCPECEAALVFYFDVQEFVLRELRDQARTVLEDVHLIARAYHWPEAEILALPRSRRMHYAERIRSEGVRREYLQE